MKYSELTLKPLFCLVKEESGFDEYYATIIFFERIVDSDNIICYQIYFEDWCSGFDEGYEGEITPLTEKEIYEILKDNSFETYHYEYQFEKYHEEMFTYLESANVSTDFVVIPIEAKNIFNILMNKYYNVIEWVPTDTSNSGKTIYKSEPSNAHRLLQLHKWPHYSTGSFLFRRCGEDPSQNDINRVVNIINQIEKSLETLINYKKAFTEYFACSRIDDYSAELNVLNINLKIKKQIEEFSNKLIEYSNELEFKKTDIGNRKR